ncbi:GerW family sporulation protein [Niveispirillum sp. KHB5.9]|uniref:GerW family sporulation protein n=1 Tax=Niveispirillum sp. KHB5.9 TaxID=3400269 RepID=UPI003A8A416D
MLPAVLSANPLFAPFFADPAQLMMTATMTAFEELLGKGVLGAPVTVGDVTIIPVTITTFGVGSGGGSLFGEPVGGGGGGGIIPVALIIITPEGARIEQLPRETTAAALEKLTDMAKEMGGRRQAR